MTLNEYIEACGEVMTWPADCCKGQDIYRADQWPEETRAELLRLHTLYVIAYDVKPAEWALQYFWDHLPADDEKKLIVLDNVGILA